MLTLTSGAGRSPSSTPSISTFAVEPLSAHSGSSLLLTASLSKYYTLLRLYINNSKLPRYTHTTRVLHYIALSDRAMRSTCESATSTWRVSTAVLALRHCASPRPTFTTTTTVRPLTMTSRCSSSTVKPNSRTASALYVCRRGVSAILLARGAPSLVMDTWAKVSGLFSYLFYFIQVAFLRFCIYEYWIDDVCSVVLVFV